MDFGKVYPPRRPGSGAPRFNRRGFTLIELLMVITVIGLLVGMTVAISGRVSSAQNEAKARGELAALAQALEGFKSYYGDYPWIEGNPDRESAENAEELFRALTGWRGFDPDATPGNPRMVDFNTQRESFIEPKAISLELPPDADTLEEAWQGRGPPPDGIYFADPWIDENGWNVPYIYVYDGRDRGKTWEGFGYILFSKGADCEIDASRYYLDGVLSPSMTEDPTELNIDNIYPGQ